jgi:hypothetical protein
MPKSASWTQAITAGEFYTSWPTSLNCQNRPSKRSGAGLPRWRKKGTVKDVQGLLRHSRAATTADVYMQEIPESVRATSNAIHAELKTKPQAVVAG